MNFVNTARRGLAKTGLAISKHAPEILLGAGIATSVGAVVATACVSKKVEFTLAASDGRRSAIRAQEADGRIETKVMRKALTKETLRTAGDLAHDLAPVILLEGISITCMCGTYSVLHKRLGAMAAAYAALDTTFRQYRGRIKSLYGDDVDKYALTGAKPTELKKGSIVDGEKLEESTKTTLLDTVENISPYARYFTRDCKMWKRDMDLNLMYLKSQERYLNSRLHIQGYLFLNEVYESFGMPPTPEGCVVGWWDDPTTGDCKVDLGLTAGVRAISTPGMEGYEHAVLINPNVDGPIYERLRDIKPDLTRILTPSSSPYQEIGLARPVGLHLVSTDEN